MASLVVIKSLINLAHGDLINFNTSNSMFNFTSSRHGIAKCSNIWLCSLLVCRFIVTCSVKNAVLRGSSTCVRCAIVLFEGRYE